MGILEGIASGFLQTVSLAVLPYLVIGSVFGLVVGVIPGLSGHFAMAMAVTFLYSMEPGSGIAFLLGAHATVSQGGGITAILFGIPGAPQNAATLLDGPAMRDKGDLGTALGAAMTSCLLGATFGAVVLALLIPVLQEAVLLFGPPEIVILAFLSLTFVAVLGREDMMRSLIAALVGLLLAMVGLDNVTNTERFTFGFERLADGLSLVPVVLGLFAVAEMIELWSISGPLARGQAKIESSRQVQRQIFNGVRVAFRKWWLVLRCSAIGTLMGLIPGVGSAPAAFVAYGHAKQSSKDKESFGKGNVEGVIGPEAANDAVEGGALASTIAFGIPGSSSMAILLSGLFILGLETGPQMLNQHVDIVFIMIFTIILGNLIGTVFGMFLVNPLSRVTTIRSSMLVPVLIAIIVSGAYASDGSLLDIAVALVFGVVGYLMNAFNYPTAPMLMGFILGPMLEQHFRLPLREVTLNGQALLLDATPISETGDTGLHQLAGGLLTLYAPNRIGERLAALHHDHVEGFDSLLGESVPIRTLKTRALRVASLDAPLLIHGETGTGKELVARGCHAISARRNAPFLALNCAALPENLAESELFGYAPGAFTGAQRGGKPGLLELANHGTVFLDEIGEMSPYLQAKLLRFLSDGSFRRVGGEREVKVNVRILSATHRDLEKMVSDGGFREDLFYRLNVVPIRLPPLRERSEDIPDLVRHFLALCEEEGLPAKSIDNAALDLLRRHRWPGNVRELENLVRRLTAIYSDEVISLEIIQHELIETDTSSSSDLAPMPEGEPESLSTAVERHLSRYFAAHGDELPPPGLYDRLVREVERPLISACLGATRGNQIRAAALLGLNRNTLRKKIKDLDIQVVRGMR